MVCVSLIYESNRRVYIGTVVVFFLGGDRPASTYSTLLIFLYGVFASQLAGTYAILRFKEDESKSRLDSDDDYDDDV